MGTAGPITRYPEGSGEGCDDVTVVGPRSKLLESYARKPYLAFQDL